MLVFLMFVCPYGMLTLKSGSRDDSLMEAVRVVTSQFFAGLTDEQLVYGVELHLMLRVVHDVWFTLADLVDLS